MPITQQEIDTIKQIILDGAKTHFPPPVQFLDADVTVRLNHEEEEFFDVELLYPESTEGIRRRRSDER